MDRLFAIGMVMHEPATREPTVVEPDVARSAKIRRALPRWLQAALFLAVFAAGGVSGAMLAHRVVHNQLERFRHQTAVFSSDITARLQVRLRLDDTQTESVAAILRRHHTAMRKVQDEAAHRMHLEFDALVAEVGEILDDAQRHRWSEIANHVRQSYLPRAIAVGLDR